MLLWAKRSKSPLIQPAQKKENLLFVLLQATQPECAAKKEAYTFVRASP